MHLHERERECESEGGQGGGRVCERRTLPRRRQSRAALSLLGLWREAPLYGQSEKPYVRPLHAALGKSDLDASPHPNALAFGLASELYPPEEAREYV